MFGEHYGQTPAMLWSSFQAVAVLFLFHREPRSRPMGCWMLDALFHVLPSHSPLLASPAIVSRLPTFPRLNSGPTKGSALIQILLPFILYPNPCHTATRPFSPSLQHVKLPRLGGLCIGLCPSQ